MKKFIANRLTKLRTLFHREDGVASVEFVVMFPAALTVLFVAGESTVVNLRKTNLDRALEMTVRDLRLGLLADTSPAGLRSLICERMGDPANCATDLTLEMVVRSTTVTNMTVPSLTATCVNRGAEINTAPDFALGTANDLVFVRACYVIDVLFPTSVAGVTVADEIGTEHQLVSTTSFVNEPT